nr:L99 [uncultured bacterium]
MAYDQAAHGDSGVAGGSALSLPTWPMTEKPRDVVTMIGA